MLFRSSRVCGHSADTNSFLTYQESPSPLLYNKPVCKAWQRLFSGLPLNNGRHTPQAALMLKNPVRKKDGNTLHLNHLFTHTHRLYYGLICFPITEDSGKTYLPKLSVRSSKVIFAIFLPIPVSTHPGSLSYSKNTTVFVLAFTF